MKKLYFLFSLTSLLFVINATAQAPSWDWAKNSIGDNFDSNFSTFTDSDGNVLVAGVFQSASILFGNVTLNNLGGKDGYIVKYNSAGEVVWAKNIGGALEQQILAITTDSSNNIFITGNFGSSLLIIDNIVLSNTNGLQDMFIAKLDSDGTAIWAKSATGLSNDYGYAIATDNDGNIFLGGQFVSNSLTLGGITINNVESDQLDHDVFIAKLNTVGDVVWLKGAGGTGYDAIDAMAVDTQGNIFASGVYYSPTITFGSNLLTNTNTFGDIYIVKYSSAGELQWTRKCGGTNYETVRDIKTDSEGNLLIAGHFESPTMTLDAITLTNAGTANNDIFLAKYSAEGQLIWARRAGGVSGDIATGVAVDSNNNVYLSGSITSNSVVFGNLSPITTIGDYDIFVVKYDSSGNAIWAKRTGAVGYDLAATATIDHNDNLFISGVSSSAQVNFDNHLINMPSYSIFTAKMNVSTLEVQNFTENRISIFPNPVLNVLNINGSNIMDENYQIIDGNGRLVKKGTTQNNDSTIDVTTLKRGLYILRFNSENIKFLKK